MAPPSSTSASTTIHKHKLPAWAQASFLKDESKSLVPLEEEEVYLRTRAYHALANELDDAVKSTIDIQISFLVVKLQAFFRQSMPNNANTSSGETLTRNVSESSINAFIVEPPTQYIPSMLPFALLPGPTNLLDRRELSKSLTTSLANGNPRTAVCHLTTTTAATSTNHCGPLVEEIWRQCVEQEGIYHMPSYASKRKRRLSPTDHWLAWANATTMFDDIIVVLEEGYIVDRLLKDFLSLLSQLRAHHGLPIQCILVTSSGSDQSSSTLLECRSNNSNLLIQTFAMPSSEIIVEGLWEHILLTSNGHFAKALPPAVLSSIRSSFQNHHASFVKTVALVKQAVALRYQCKATASASSTGIYKDDADAVKRLSWFCLDPWGRQILTGTRGATKNTLVQRQERQRTLCCTLSCLMKALSKLLLVDSVGNTNDTSTTPGTKSTSATNLILDIEESLHTPFSMKAMARRIIHKLKEENAVLTRLAFARTALVGEALSSSEDAALVIQVQKVNELIVLLGQHYSAEDGKIVRSDSKDKDNTNEKESVQRYLWQSVEEWIYELLQMLETTHAELNKSPGRAATSLHQDTVCQVLLPEHRRHIATALIGHESKSKTTKKDRDALLRAVPSELFRLMTNIVAIERYEWFDLYKDWIGFDDSDKDEAWALFSVGVHQLIYVGLIREKRGVRRIAGQIFYEKAALVWSTGE